MVLRAKTRLYHLSGDKYAIYIPKAIQDDSQFPFKDKKATLEIIIIASEDELLVTPYREPDK